MLRTSIPHREEASVLLTHGYFYREWFESNVWVGSIRVGSRLFHRIQYKYVKSFIAKASIFLFIIFFSEVSSIPAKVTTI
jgi:hypothetical protein